MKGTKVALILASAFLLCSCNGDGKSEASNTSGASGDTSSTSFVGNPWGEKLASEIYETVQCIIPYQEGNIAFSGEDVDEYGDPYIAIYLTYESEDEANAAFNSYANTCASNGYTVEITTLKYIDWETYEYFLYDVAYADLVIGDHLGVEIQSTVSKYQGKDALGIFASNYVAVEKTEYPQACVDKLLGYYGDKIPQVVGEGYTYSHLFFIDAYGNQGLEIQVKGATYEVEKQYFDALQKETKYYQIKCDSLDDDYSEKAEEYEEYDDQFYYMCFLDPDICVIYDYDLYNQTFVIDIFASANS